MQLKQDLKILDYMQAFKTDLTNHFKKEIKGNKQKIIIMVRVTGLDWFTSEGMLKHMKKYNLDINEEVNSFYVWAKYNERFYYSEDGILKQIQMKELKQILFKWFNHNSICSC